MQKNFVIDNGIALEGDHFYLDVHNCYSLVDFEMNTKSGKSNINISFKKAEECFLDGRPFNFRMSFLNISYFDCKGLFSKSIHDIELIGYKETEDNDLSWLLEEKHFDINCCMVFLFNDDSYLKVQCEKIELLEIG